MKYFLIIFFMLFSNKLFAEYTFVVPQKPGGGTTIWAEIVAKELEPFLGEKIKIKTISGARDIPGFNKFHNELRFDDKTVMVSHGGNAVSFLQENVDYDYSDYESIGLMNLNIIVGKRKDSSKVVFAAGSGQTPEAYAMAMLLCGNGKTVQEYVSCFSENVNWVKGMSSSERRIAFKRSELTVTRENPAAYKKHVETDKNAEIWFHHGILKGQHHVDDINYAGYQFEELFKNKWGEYPNGNFYDSYKLLKSFRDGLQKALWVDKNNPNKKILIDALVKMRNNKSSMSVIQNKVGNYEWIVGDDGNKHRDNLMSLINEKAIDTMIYFNRNALGLNSVKKL